MPNLRDAKIFRQLSASKPDGPRHVPQITLTDFSESYIRKKGEVEQHSRVGDYERMVTLQEQGPRKRPYTLQTKLIEASRIKEFLVRTSTSLLE